MSLKPDWSTKRVPRQSTKIMEPCLEKEKKNLGLELTVAQLVECSPSMDETLGHILITELTRCGGTPP